jgi:hypothetical protein
MLDPAVREGIQQNQIRLVRFRDVVAGTARVGAGDGSVQQLTAACRGQQSELTPLSSQMEDRK